MTIASPSGHARTPAPARRLAANHSTALPTLIAGNPADPVMLFIHGWPDSAALWVNHFEAFCLNQTSGHYCVALTWTNHHPDFPEVGCVSDSCRQTGSAINHVTMRPGARPCF